MNDGSIYNSFMAKYGDLEPEAREPGDAEAIAKTEALIASGTLEENALTLAESQVAYEQAQVRDRGNVALRLPKSLHTSLKNAARAEGVSLNQYIVSLLAYGIGRNFR